MLARGRLPSVAPPAAVGHTGGHLRRFGGRRNPGPIAMPRHPNEVLFEGEKPFPIIPCL
jgi:hypothetical protein